MNTHKDLGTHIACTECTAPLPSPEWDAQELCITQQCEECGIIRIVMTPHEVAEDEMERRMRVEDYLGSLM